MGGHLAGEVASQWAVGTLKRELAPLFRPQDPSVTRRLDAEALAAVGSGVTVRLEETDLARLLEHAVERANQVLLGYARKHPDEAGDMGSTLTLAVVEGDRAHGGPRRRQPGLPVARGQAAAIDRGSLGAGGAAQAGQDHARGGPRPSPPPRPLPLPGPQAGCRGGYLSRRWPCSRAMACCSVPTGCGTWSIPSERLAALLDLRAPTCRPSAAAWSMRPTRPAARTISPSCWCELEGRGMAEYCPQCGAPIKAGARFCTKCGVRLAAAGLAGGDGGLTGPLADGHAAAGWPLPGHRPVGPGRHGRRLPGQGHRAVWPAVRGQADAALFCHPERAAQGRGGFQARGRGAGPAQPPRPSPHSRGVWLLCRGRRPVSGDEVHRGREPGAAAGAARSAPCPRRR